MSQSVEHLSQLLSLAERVTMARNGETAHELDAALREAQSTLAGLIREGVAALNGATAPVLSVGDRVRVISEAQRIAAGWSECGHIGKFGVIETHKNDGDVANGRGLWGVRIDGDSTERCYGDADLERAP